MRIPLTKHIDTTLVTEDGETKTYRLYRLPYASGGRKLITQFIPTALPKVGAYDENEKLMELMFSHIAVIREDGNPLMLETKVLIDNHVPDCKTGLQLEKEMMQFNAFFLKPESLSSLSTQAGQMLQVLISKMLTELKQSSPTQEKQQSTNSGQSTT
jgi:hypothetical protein